MKARNRIIASSVLATASAQAQPLSQSPKPAAARWDLALQRAADPSQQRPSAASGRTAHCWDAAMRNACGKRFAAAKCLLRPTRERRSRN